MIPEGTRLSRWRRLGGLGLPLERTPVSDPPESHNRHHSLLGVRAKKESDDSDFGL
jgi:hypothetical protein